MNRRPPRKFTTPAPTADQGNTADKGDSDDCCEVDAQSLIDPKHIKRFLKIAASMDNLLREIREYCPEANMYLEDSGNWNLMTGPSHDDMNSSKPRQDRVAISALVMNTDGGGW